MATHQTAPQEHRQFQWSIVWRYLAVALIVIVSPAPLYWTFTTSIKDGLEVTASPPTLFPHSFILDNYANVMTSSFFLPDLRNSAIVASVTTVLALLIGSIWVFAIARIKFPGKP